MLVNVLRRSASPHGGRHRAVRSNPPVSISPQESLPHSPTSNYGSTNNIFIESAVSGTYGNERGWLRFDLPSLPAGSTITSAKLNRFCSKAIGASLQAFYRYSADNQCWGAWSGNFTTAQDVPAMLGRAWFTLGGALVVVASGQLSQHRKIGMLAQS